MAIKRTYGKIRFEKQRPISDRPKDKDHKCDQWVIYELEPHVCIKLKKIFPRIDVTATVPFLFPYSAESCADLTWFMGRYPLECSESDYKKLKRGNKEYVNMINDLENILLPEYQYTDNYELNEGFAARHYQSVAVDLFMKCQRLLIGDSLGLGKSGTAIFSLLRKGTLPAAIVVPAHLPTHWIDQIAKFTKLSVHFIKGTTLYDLPKADVYVFKYSNIFGWVDVFQTGFFKEVIFDEVQDLRTGKGSAKYRAAEVLSLNVDYCMMLSATPIYNWANEIWNILNLMKRDCLGSFEDFTREWGSWDGKRFMCKDTKALGTYLRQQFLFLQRTREDVGMELPEVNKIVHTIDYDQGLMDKDMALAKTLAITVLHGSFIERGQAHYHLNALIRHSTGVAKAKYVAEYVKTLLLENKIPCILCGWHRSVYQIWEKEFEEYKPVFFTGHESAKQKDAAVTSFINGDTDLFIMSLRSGAGIDGLQNRAHYIIYGELDWSPKVHDQSTGRLNRDRDGGEKQQVTAVYLNSNGGADPMMLEVLGMKSSQQHGIINPLAGPESQFSDHAAIQQLAASYLKNKGVTQQEIDNSAIKVPLSSCCGTIILTPGYCNTCELPCEIIKEPSTI